MPLPSCASRDLRRRKPIGTWDLPRTAFATRTRVECTSGIKIPKLFAPTERFRRQCRVVLGLFLFVPNGELLFGLLRHERSFTVRDSVTAAQEFARTKKRDWEVQISV